MALTNNKEISSHSRTAEARALVKARYVFCGLADEILKAAMPQKFQVTSEKNKLIA